MGIPRARQAITDEIGHMPRTAAFNPGGQHQLAGIMHMGRAIGAAEGQAQQAVFPCNTLEIMVIGNRQLQDVTVPVQIVLPLPARDLVQLFPCLGPILGFIP